MSTSTPARPDGDDAPPPKTTLFCPECGHESPQDGDWHRVERHDRTAVECPACGATIAIRPLAASACHC